MSKYVITDPCYILPNEMWIDCIETAEKTKGDWSKNFTKQVTKALSEFTGNEAWANSTGFGDWNNTIYGPCVDDMGTFFADSGMVCVCEYTKAVKEALGTIIDKGGAATFEAVGPLKVNFDDTCPDWIVVEISDANGNEWNTSYAD